MADDGRSVLVAGAGPTGLSAALELCRRGIMPRIVDSEAGPAPMRESRALGVNARTLTLLSASGVSDRILAAAMSIPHFRVYSGSRLLMDIRTSDVRGAYNAIYALPQGHTERLLLARLEDYGVRPEWNTKLETVSGDPARPQVTLRRPDGGSEDVMTDIVIGAEGAHSEVRRALHLGFPGEQVETCFYLADYRYEQPLDDRDARVRLFNPGVLGHLPLAPDALRYISTLADYEARIEHPGKVAELMWKSEFRVHFRHVGEMARGNIFLAGDAAHIHSPAGARGMNLGIEDACWLAYLIAERRESEYSALRMPAVHQVMEMTRRLTALIAMQHPASIGIRNVLVPMAFRIPPLGKRLLRSVAGYDTPPPPWIAGAE